MSHAASLHAHQLAQPASRAAALSVLLLAWLGLIVALGAFEAFVAPPGAQAPPLPLRWPCRSWHF